MADRSDADAVNIRPFRRANSETLAFGENGPATIRPLASEVKRRRSRIPGLHPLNRFSRINYNI
jgi:hypothetical protein